MKYYSLKKVSYTCLLIILSFCFLNTSCKKEKKITPYKITFKKEATLTLHKAENDSILSTLDIEIADNAFERDTGLMHREAMADQQGMLFVFPDMAMRYFYMKNTQIPLDLIYIDSNFTVVHIIQNAKPFDETSLPSKKPTQYVLEVNAGLVNTWNLQVGDKMDYNKIP